MEIQKIGSTYTQRERIPVGPSKTVTSMTELSMGDLEAMLEKAEEHGVVGRAQVQEQEKRAPYSFLAKGDGESRYIEHKGVVFLCDDKNQALTLGDMSDSSAVLTIPLEKGGCLKVNRANLGDLASAIDMFSPADVGRIMRAIAADNRAQGMKRELEEEEGSVVNLG
ncbi:MAG: hypothetical protein HFI76_01300 [Lachnospiraceae bacterium]|jgi:hypothetical protein|nr:hypothetical protein [Lachnospiraceae bacterium]